MSSDGVSNDSLKHRANDKDVAYVVKVVGIHGQAQLESWSYHSPKTIFGDLARWKRKDKESGQWLINYWGFNILGLIS